MNHIQNSIFVNSASYEFCGRTFGPLATSNLHRTVFLRHPSAETLVWEKSPPLVPFASDFVPYSPQLNNYWRILTKYKEINIKTENHCWDAFFLSLMSLSVYRSISLRPLTRMQHWRMPDVISVTYVCMTIRCINSVGTGNQTRWFDAG